MASMKPVPVHDRDEQGSQAVGRYSECVYRPSKAELVLIYLVQAHSHTPDRRNNRRRMLSVHTKRVRDGF